MLTDRKMWPLFDAVLAKKDLDVNLLRSLGFSDVALNRLVNKGILCKEDDHLYTFISAELIDNYGKDLRRMHIDEKSRKCFLLCTAIDKDYINQQYDSICQAIERKDYKRAMEYCLCLKKYNEEDAFLFMRMLRYSASLPENLAKKAEGIYLNHVGAVKKYSDTADEKKVKDIKYRIMQHKFREAIHLLNDFTFRKSAQSRFLAYHSLITACIQQQERNHYVYQELAEKEDFTALFKTLLSDHEVHGLSILDEHILLILKDLDLLTSLGVMHPLQNHKGGIFESIRSHDYMSAYSFFLTYLEEYGRRPYDIVIEVVLKKINQTLMETLQTQVRTQSFQHLDQILEAVIYSGKSIEQVGEEFGLNHNQLAVVRLVIARFFRRARLFQVSDDLISTVEQQEYKSKTVKRFIDEVKGEELKSHMLSKNAVAVLKRIKIENLVGI